MRPSMPPPAARPPSCGSSGSAARRSASTTPIRRRRPTTRTSAWACASWSTARSASPPRSTCGRRRRPTWCARPGTWRRSPAGPGGGRVELAPEPSHGDVTWSSAFEIDPSTVPLADKVALLARLEPAPRRARRGLAHLGVAARRVGADVPGRPQRDTGHPAPGAAAGAARGAGTVGQRLRDHAHAGAARRPRLGVPDRSGLRRRLALGRGAGASCPSCWPRSSARPRSRRGRTTSSSTPRTCGSPSTSRSGTPPSSTGPSATRPPTPARRSPPSTSSARSPTAPPSCT